MVRGAAPRRGIYPRLKHAELCPQAAATFQRIRPLSWNNGLIANPLLTKFGGFGPPHEVAAMAP